MSLCMGLRFWLQQEIDDFYENCSGKISLNLLMYELLKEFFKLLKYDESFELSLKMRELLKRSLERIEESENMKLALLHKKAYPQPPPVEPAYDSCINLLPLKALADQLTLLEFEILSNISLKTLREKKWVENCPDCPVYRMIGHFNNTSYWVVHSILSFHNPQARAHTIVKFAELAQILRKQYNFNTMMAIDGALQHTTVERLKLTFTYLSEKDRKLLEDLRNFTSASHNFRNYREVQRSRNGFCIPYIGLYLRDLIYTEDGQDTWIHGGGFINVKKLESISASVSEIVRCQEVPPTDNLVLMPQLMGLCKKLLSHSITEDQLYALSQKVEARSTGTRHVKQTKKPSANSDDLICQIYDMLAERYFDQTGFEAKTYQRMLLDIPPAEEFRGTIMNLEDKDDWLHFLKCVNEDSKKKFTVNKSKKKSQKL
ncbi:RAS guanyl-releasing protein 1-like [Zophobas morio]|uniref:RAS guanyl-releasing protein 1-like n=1 Tax=Zophobas morio TaxID=2755281 RepID=UPI003082F198